MKSSRWIVFITHWKSKTYASAPCPCSIGNWHKVKVSNMSWQALGMSVSTLNGWHYSSLTVNIVKRSGKFSKERVFSWSIYMYNWGSVAAMDTSARNSVPCIPIHGLGMETWSINCVQNFCYTRMSFLIVPHCFWDSGLITCTLASNAESVKRRPKLSTNQSQVKRTTCTRIISVLHPVTPTRAGTNGLKINDAGVAMLK